MLTLLFLVSLFGCSAQCVTVPETPFCVDECRTDYETAYAFDHSGWVNENLSNVSFWQAPTTLDGASPGDVLKWEDLDAATVGTDYTIPGGTSLSRFVYVTQDEDGTLLPATAFALLPFALPTAGEKLRTIVWAHGTAGLAATCAPTNHRSLYYDWSAPYAYVQAGYAVIAPDYTGLGIQIPQGFMYLAGWSHAADAAYSLIAAREVIGDFLTDDWAAVGQSEGGAVVWRLNERLSVANESLFSKIGSFIGAVSIAPALRPTDYVDDNIADPQFGSVFALLAGYIFYTVSGLYPNFHADEYLTEAGLEKMNFTAQNGCSLSGTFAYAGTTKDDFLKNDSWSKDPAVIDWRHKHTGEGRTAKLSAPMLVIQGQTDGLVTPDSTLQDLEQTCAQNNATGVQYREYEGVDHDLVTGTAQVDYLAWLKERFDGVKTEPGCTKTTVANMTDRFYPAMRVYTEKAYS